MAILSDYPWYYMLLCLLVGGAYSAILYWRSPLTRDHSLPSAVRVALPVLRFVTVSVIAMLLMAPLVKRHTHTEEKPIIVVAKDVSASVDPAQAHLIDQILPELEKRYEVVLDSFGGKTTDIASELTSIADRLAGRNLGAVILASDGIYNQGQNPTNTCTQLAAPIYTLALGDTTHRPDASIAHLRYNQMAYLGNQFPIEVTIQAHLLQGKHATLSVTRNGQRLYTKEINYNANPFTLQETLTLTANKPGVQSYTVSITPCEGESVTANNSRTIIIEVIDGHQKIAILAAAPHPDISALRQSIEQNPNYEVEVKMLDNAQPIAWLRECNLLILHNLPTASQQLTQIAALQIPTIYIIGTQTDLGRFNALHSGLEIVAKAKKYDEATAAHNKAFALFNIDPTICAQLEQLPPLSSPFGNYRMSGNVQPLFYAKVGQVTSDRPMIAFGQQEGVRQAFVVGEGLWRWRLQDYQMNESHHNFDQLVEKMVVYTSLTAAKDRFHVTHEHIYRESEPIVLQAELYNDNFEPVNTPDATIKITGAKQHASTYDFNRSGTGYTLRLGTLGPGQYSYAAHTTFNSKPYTATGTFAVEQQDLEQINLVADHTLLYTLAQTTGGAMVTPDLLKQLPQLLEERNDLKSILYPHTHYTELLDLPLLFILIILLLTAEWGLRKYYLN